ncbi:MAG: response regulator [Gomphosphaeria aponina SAG 52.96 = DSM 107014]|uniref:histidine kinase n=1 Tax=Gomphosphaeria aponina SAG 52.96 = DSM 107014 TaxID=1521640 RepID=A0A941GU45_9CHRO|nr:response regulator [Gomphosphaeria aponina SAG 52.96 = DSM 107014]
MNTPAVTHLSTINHQLSTINYQPMLDPSVLEAIAQEARNSFLFEDAPEYLAILTKGINQLQIAYTKPSGEENLTKIYQNLGRAAHSIKGGAGMAGMSVLHQLAHKIEDLFEAVEQERVTDKTTAFQLLNLGIEAVENLIEAACNNLPEAETNTQELTSALEEFLQTIEVATNSSNLLGDSTEFIKTAISVDLEACIQRVEELLSQPTPTLQSALIVFEEECSLLGQALNLPWLETAANLMQQIRTLNKIPLKELAQLGVAEVRHLTTQFLANFQPPQMSTRLTNLLPSPPKPILLPPEEKPQENQTFSPQGQNVRISLEKLNRMSDTVGELFINYERLLVYESQLQRASNNLKKNGKQLHPLQEQIQSFYDNLTITNQHSAEFDPLEFDRYTEVHTNLQKFQELMVQVMEIREDIDLVRQEFKETLVEVRHYLDLLHQDVIQSRLVTFGSVAGSFVQPLEKLNQQYHKSAQLVIEGENVLVDQAVIEQLRTPLTHLIRNAFDHGIEPPQQRKNAGKNPTGIIKLAAAISSNQVIITISDNGRGINLTKVYQKAISLGFCSEKTSFEPLKKAQILDFIFLPGFSTADNVSSLSGRGMGLDIVRLQVERLRGNLTVASTFGKGTKFTVRIPLSLNILPLLLCRCQQQTLAIPSSYIQTIISLMEFPPQKFTISWQHQVIPFRNLAQLLPYNQPGIFDHSLPSPKVGLVLKIPGKNLVVGIDNILTEKELVVKPFDDTVPFPSYLAGCTILGTGEVVPVLIPDFFDELLSAQPEEIKKKDSISNPPSILVIDDSIAVRKTLTRILTQSGFTVVQCRDGKEAWTVLNQGNQRFNLAICDLEMPELDGFSLLKMIRSHDFLQHLPVMILTSRDNDLHREKAKTLGANAYFTKPFHPVSFLEAIASFLTP